MADRTCSVDGCAGKHQARSYCFKHWKKWRKYGDPLGGYTPDTLHDYLARNSEQKGACIEWAGTRLSNGYGSVGLRAHSKMLAHRAAYEVHVGAIPDGMQIDHLCRNRACINPDHLEAVTQQENMARGLQSRILNGMDDSCIHGHRYTPENTYVNPNNPADRRCRQCAEIRQRARTVTDRKRIA